MLPSFSTTGWYWLLASTELLFRHESTYTYNLVRIRKWRVTKHGPAFGSHYATLHSTMKINRTVTSFTKHCYTRAEHLPYSHIKVSKPQSKQRRTKDFAISAADTRKNMWPDTFTKYTQLKKNRIQSHVVTVQSRSRYLVSTWKATEYWITARSALTHRWWAPSHIRCPFKTEHYVLNNFELCTKHA